MQAKALFEDGHLAEAIHALEADVRSQPLAEGSRSFLVELLCFAGHWERADRQLEVLARQQPEAAYGVHVYRQLLRAAQAREQFLTSARLPEFMASPPDDVQASLKAWVLLRDGATSEAASLLASTEADRSPLMGTCNDDAFSDFRDLDDITAHVLEILTVRGLYYWVPLSQLQSLIFEAPDCPRDLLWRPARMGLGDEVDEHEVFVPTIYGETAGRSEAAQLGRETDWLDLDGGITRGIGQRMFLIGDDTVPIMEIQELTFENGT